MIPEVFYYLAPKIIYGCGNVKDIRARDVNNPTEEGSQVDENGPMDKGRKNQPI